jgi:hypothetical protein
MENVLTLMLKKKHMDLLSKQISEYLCFAVGVRQCVNVFVLDQVASLWISKLRT